MRVPPAPLEVDAVGAHLDGVANHLHGIGKGFGDPRRVDAFAMQDQGAAVIGDGLAGGEREDKGGQHRGKVPEERKRFNTRGAEPPFVPCDSSL